MQFRRHAARRHLDLPHACRTRYDFNIARCLKCSLAFCAALRKRQFRFLRRLNLMTFHELPLKPTLSVEGKMLPRLLRALILNFMLYEGVVLFISLAFQKARRYFERVNELKMLLRTWI